MFIVTLSAVIIIATLFMIITWTFFKQGKQKLTSLLIIPYFFYFVVLLLFGNDQVLGVYLNQQIYTLSLGYFAVHAMLTLFIVSEMIKALECQGSKVNDNLQ